MTTITTVNHKLQVDLPHHPTGWRLTLLMVLTGVVYYFSARLGLYLAYEHSSVSPVWPPTGVAIAALLLLGYRAWPGVFVGALVANLFTTSVDFITASAIATGNTFEALAAAWLTNHLAGGRLVFDRLWNIARYVFIASPAAVTISASVGVGALVASGAATFDIAPKLWLTWWLGDLVGALVITPLIMIWANRHSTLQVPWRPAEAVCLTLVSLTTIFLLFSGAFPGVFDRQTLGFFVIPPMAWAAFRFGSRGAIAIATLISAGAVIGTINQHGPFFRDDLNYALLVVQAFVGVVTVTSLAIAAVVQELHKAEALQRQSTQRLEMALKAGNMGAWKWDIVSGAVSWSPTLETIHGLAPGQFGGTIEDFRRDIHPDDRQRVDDAIRQTLENRANHSYNISYRILRPSGEKAWLEATGQVTRDESGTPIEMTGVCSDVTAQKRAENSLRASELLLRARAEELQAIMDAVPAVVWVAHDPQCRLITGNKTAQEFLQLSPGANASKTAPSGEKPNHFRVYRDGVEVPDDQLPVQLAASQGQHIIGETYELRFDDGSVSYEYGNAVPLFDEAGNVRGAIATFIDISSLKRAETELQSVKDKLAADLDDMTRLHELSMRLLNVEHQDLNALLQQVLEACAALLGTTMGNIQILDERDQTLNIVAHMGFSQEFLEHFKSVPLGYSACGSALKQRERVIVENISNDPRFAEFAPIFTKFGFVAVQSTPLFSSDGKLFGMLSNHFAHPHRPSDQDLRLLDLYAQQAARVLERHRSEQALREQYERLQALYTLARAIGSADALDDIYHQSIQSLLRALHADRASVLLFDPDGIMRFKAWHGLSEQYRKAVEGHSPWKQDEADPQPITMDDVASRTDLGPLRDVVLDEGIRALAFIPLQAGGRLLGKFMVYFDQPHRFSEDEVHLARTIAGHVTFALERLSAQRQLRESDQISRRRLAELTAIYSDVPVGLCFVNNDERFVKVNPRFAEIHGLSAAQMIGRRVQDVFASEREIAEIIRRVIATGDPVLDLEKTVALPDGSNSQRDWLQSFCPVTDAAGEVVGVNCVVVDITERKRIEREIQLHRERLEELVAQRTADLQATHQRLRASERLAAMGTLSAGLGHDMGNLLLPMKSRLDVLQSLDLPLEVHEHLRGIELCAKYLQDLVRGLRLFSQDPAEVGSDAATNLREWQMQTYPFYHSVLPRSVKLDYDIPEHVPPVAVAPHALTQAVLNLVNNARDAIGPEQSGQVLVRARLESSPDDRGRTLVRVSIIDDGPGMNHAVRARALEPFFTTKTRSLSTGLGLSMVHGLVRSAGGTVEIHSPPQTGRSAPDHGGVSEQAESQHCRGTEISLILPAAMEIAADDDQSFERPQASISVSDPRASAVLSSMLDSMGFQVVEANGKPDGGAVWFTEPSEQKLAAAQAFLQAEAGRAVVVVGDAPPEWLALPIKIIDRTCKPSAIRAALADLVQDLAGGTDHQPN